MRSIWITLAIVAGCGDDARPPGGTAVLSVSDDSGAPVTTLEFGATNIGAAQTAHLTVTDIGEAASGPIGISITGPSANEFVLDNQLTTCAPGLAPGAQCTVALAFRPSDVGARSATLSLTYAGDQVDVALAGQALQTLVHFVPASIDFGQVESTLTAHATVEIHNDGTTDAPVDLLVAAGPGFARGATTCGATLAAGAVCEVAVDYQPTALGAQAGMLALTTANTTISAPLAAHGAHRVTVDRSGTGTGTVTSTPAGIDCGSTCSALFEGDVTLAEAPGATTVFSGWSTCGLATECVVPAVLDPVSVTATFALSGSASLTIDFQGAAAITEARVSNGVTTTTCSADCLIPVETGQTISILVGGIGVYQGMTGACTTATAQCSYTQPAGASTVVVTRDAFPKELWTRVGSGRPAFDTAGNLVLAGAQIVKLDSSGATIFTKSDPVQDGGQDFVIGPGDTMYFATGTELVKLDASATEIWRRAASATCFNSSGAAACLAVGSDGAAAVVGDGVTHWDTDGVVTWTQPFNLGCGGVAIGAAGVVSYTHGSEPGFVGNFAADGSPLPDNPAELSGRNCGLAVTSDGHLEVMSSGFSNLFVTGFYTDSVSVGSGATFSRLATSRTGTAQLAYLYDEFDGTAGFTVRRVAPAKAVVVHYDSATDGIAMADDGRLAVTSVYNRIDGSILPFVQTFAP